MRIDRKKVKPEEKIVWPRKVLKYRTCYRQQDEGLTMRAGQGRNEDEWEEVYENAKISQQTQ